MHVNVPKCLVISITFDLIKVDLKKTATFIGKNVMQEI